MRGKFRAMLYGGTFCFVAALRLTAGPLGPHELLGYHYYTLDFGTQGVGTDSLTGTGMKAHGAFAHPQNFPIRFFDGEPGGSQALGVYDLAYKNGPGDETVTDHLPNRGPAVGSALYGGGSFDGTALWLAPSKFQAGLAPAIGGQSPPNTGTGWDGVTRAADYGVDVRVTDANLILIPVVQNVLTQLSYLIRMQVYLPGHEEDRDGSNPIKTAVRVQPYVDREGYGLTSPGGLGYRTVSFSTNAWSLFEIRADFTTDGGSLPGSSDDSGTVKYTYFVNGSQVGAADTFVLDPTWMQSRTGPVRFGPGGGLFRGWQGDAPSVYWDNISVFEIIPEPGVAGLLALGSLVILRRRFLQTNH